MATNYWGIVGYGVNVSKKILSLKKVVKELNLNPDDYKGHEDPFDYLSAENPDGYDLDVVEILEEMLEKKEFKEHSNYLTVENTCNMDMGVFLAYTPYYPWRMSEKEKAFTKEDIEEIIINIMERITDFTREEILDMFEDISTCGAG